MEKNIIQTALKYLSDTKDSNYKIYKSTGISQSALGNYKKGLREPTPANAQLLIQYFEGGLLQNSSEARVLENFNFMSIPLVHIHARAGYARGYGDLEYIDTLPTFPVIVDRNYKGKYRVFEVEGDSMEDGSMYSICNGDKVLCREVKQEYWKTRLHYKDWFFVIVMREDGILTKQIISHDVENHKIVCHSLNPMFEDFEVDLADVAELYNVIKIVDRNTRI